jgi:hypothetical protein
VRKAVFIHGLFRSGSTYLFDKLRQNESYWCYYEPFHHALNNLDQGDIDLWKHKGKTSTRMSHPLLSRPHFYEYSRCFHEGHIKYFDKSLSYDRFLIGSDSDFLPEKKYIDHLILSSPKGCTPVLQFNRSTFRLKNLADSYPDSSHFFLLRNPRNQFQSYVNSGPIFLILNLIIGARLIEKGCSLPVDISLFKHKSIAEDLAFYSKILQRIKLMDHYKIFLYLWSGSLKYAMETGCKIIDMDRTNSDELEALFSQELDIQLNFKDYRSNSSNQILLTSKETVDSEKCVFDEFIMTSGPSKQCVMQLSSLTEGKVEFKPRLRFKYYQQLLREVLLRFHYVIKFKVPYKAKNWILCTLGLIKRGIKKLLGLIMRGIKKY